MIVLIFSILWFTIWTILTYLYVRDKLLAPYVTLIGLILITFIALSILKGFQE